VTLDETGKADCALAGWVFKISFEANDLSTREALKTLRGAMHEEGFEADMLSRVEMALAELFNNIAEHAYANVGYGEVAVRMHVDEATIVVDVKDHGLPMPNGILPDGTLPETRVALADLPEGGFGWHIIRTQTDNLSYLRDGSENLTCLRFNCAES
jgi:serine/threonine-protein kinase RsbW